MALFGGSFGMGLAQGLAGSIDNALKTAMDKRDEDVSRVQRYHEMRQAQKQDMADEHDARAERALNRLIDGFEGDVAKGLAAYQALGGSVDAVEDYIGRVDATLAVGEDYKISNRFNFDGIDLTPHADLSRADALASVRMDLGPVNVDFQETGLLQRLGMPLRGDVGADISSSVNQMIPSRERTPIEGLTGAGVTVDYTGTREQMDYALARATNLAQLKALEEKQQARGYNLAQLENAYDNYTNTQMLYDRFQFGNVGGPGGKFIFTDLDGDKFEGDAALTKMRGEIANAEMDYVENMLLDSQGNFNSPVAEQAFVSLNLGGDLLARTQQRMRERQVLTDAVMSGDMSQINASQQSSVAPAQINFFDASALGNQAEINSSIANDPMGYLQGLVQQQPSLAANRAALGGRLKSAGLEDARIDAILDQFLQTEEPEAPIFSTSTSRAIVNR